MIFVLYFVVGSHFGFHRLPFCSVFGGSLLDRLVFCRPLFSTKSPGSTIHPKWARGYWGGGWAELLWPTNKHAFAEVSHGESPGEKVVAHGSPTSWCWFWTQGVGQGPGWCPICLCQPHFGWWLTLQWFKRLKAATINPNSEDSQRIPEAFAG